MRVQVSPLDGTAKLEGSGVSEWRNLQIEVRRRKKERRRVGEKESRMKEERMSFYISRSLR